MKKAWYRPRGWSYWPISWQGWVLALLTDIFILHVLLYAALSTHSLSDALLVIFPYVVPAFLLWDWIAAKKSS